MTLLNPLALLFIPALLWIFREKLLTKRQYKQTKLLIIVLLFILIALSRPAITNEIKQEKFDANEYIIALDASYSMQMQDIKPSRYRVAKKNIISLLKKSKQDRFTLYVFTKNPLLIVPPTTDTAIAINAIEAVEPKFILTKGTSITALIKQVAMLEQEHKSLIVFSDGGEDESKKDLLKLLKRSAITLNVVAVGSTEGTVIIKDGKVLKDKNSHLIISRINPILKTLAYESGGFYFNLNANRDISEALLKKMQTQNLQTQELQTDVVSYKELYSTPLVIAFLILLISLTKVINYLPFFSLLLLTLPLTKVEASLLDFYFIKIAKEAYKQGKYTKAQNYYKKLSPSQYSYMSIANSYYKSGEYKNALNYYSQITSKKKEIKSILFYNMANTAFKLKRYERAYTFYKQSLSISYSQEAYENMITLLQLENINKKNVADMLPTKSSKIVQHSSKVINSKKEEKSEGSSSTKKERDAQGTQGGTGGKSKKKEINSATKKSTKKKFQMGYNAYELINKGYVNEKNPW